jgi:glycosyltransferase involved in cell wall biosynthesis
MVSIVVAAYNAAPFIAETVGSVFKQTFTDYELIIVNDGSKDTEELELALQPDLERIIYLKQENQGSGAARNRGLRTARGQYIAFLDADDVWLPTYLEEQIRFMQSGNYDLVYADAVLFGDSPLSGRTYMETAPSRGRVTFQSLIRGQCNVITSGVVARKELIFEVGLFDEALRNAQDFDLWVRLIRRGARASYQRKVLLRYRYHGGSLSGDAANRVARELRVLDKIESCYKLTPDEREEVAQAKEKIRANLELERGKLYLSQSKFTEAHEAFKKANRTLKSWKLKAVILSLNIAPRLLLRVAGRRLPSGHAGD